MKKKYNWKKIGKNVRNAGIYIGKHGSRLAYDIAVNEGRALRKEGGFANLQGQTRRKVKGKILKRKIIVYDSKGRKKIKKVYSAHKRIKRPIRRSEPFNPFGLDF